MQISRRTWSEYIKQLSTVNKRAADIMREYVRLYGLSDVNALIQYAYSITSVYGEAAASLACEMYDAISAAEGIVLPAAIPAETLSIGEIARDVQGVINTASSLLPATVGRFVKQAGADTMLQNAKRDGAQFAWIPNGDTCAFCVMIASEGWQYMSRDALKGGHAEHIHSNCDCEYAIRHSERTSYAGYNPDKYLKIYEDADGTRWQDKLNAMRREFYAEDKERINALKRAAYARRSEESELLET